MQSDKAVQKNFLRKTLRDQRATLSAEQRAKKDACIANQLYSTEYWQQADLVLTYLSYADEVDTLQIIETAWAMAKQIAIPRRSDMPHAMDWFKIESFHGLVKTPLGILEPDPTLHKPWRGYSEINRPRRVLALIPALAFDRRGFRIGYGGGFYDVFLDSFSGTSLGLCRNCFLLDEIPAVEAHDRRVDFVVTENRFLNTQTRRA